MSQNFSKIMFTVEEILEIFETQYNSKLWILKINQMIDKLNEDSDDIED